PQVVDGNPSSITHQFVFTNSTPLTISATATDEDGTYSANTASVQITSTNQPPVLGNIDPSATVTYTENGSAVLIAAAGTASDANLLDFDGGTLRVSLGAQATVDDRLSIKNVGTGTNQISVSGSSLIFNGQTIGSFTGGDGQNDLVITFNAN